MARPGRHREALSATFHFLLSSYASPLLLHRSSPSRCSPCPTSGTAWQTSRSATGHPTPSDVLRPLPCLTLLSSAQVLTKSLQPLPDKWHGLADIEKRYRQRYLDMIVTEETRNTLRSRSKVVSAIRRHLEGKDFLEVCVTSVNGVGR